MERKKMRPSDLHVSTYKIESDIISRETTEQNLGVVIQVNSSPE